MLQIHWPPVETSANVRAWRRKPSHVEPLTSCNLEHTTVLAVTLAGPNAPCPLPYALVSGLEPVSSLQSVSVIHAYHRAKRITRHQLYARAENGSHKLLQDPTKNRRQLVRCLWSHCPLGGHHQSSLPTVSGQGRSVDGPIESCPSHTASRPNAQNPPRALLQMLTKRDKVMTSPHPQTNR